MVLLRKYYSTFTGVLDLLSKKQKTNGKETDSFPYGNELNGTEMN